MWVYSSSPKARRVTTFVAIVAVVVVLATVRVWAITRASEAADRALLPRAEKLAEPPIETPAVSNFIASGGLVPAEPTVEEAADAFAHGPATRRDDLRRF